MLWPPMVMTPGWKRLQNNSKRSCLAAKRYKNLIIDATASSIFEIGDRVFHQKFGYGNIQDIEEINFKLSLIKQETKKLFRSLSFRLMMFNCCQTFG